MSRYQTERSGNDSLGQAVMAIVTGGISIFFGGKTTYDTTVKDNATGKSHTGYGNSHSQAKSNAITGLQNGKGRK